MDKPDDKLDKLDYIIIDNRDPSRQRMIPLRGRFPRLAAQEETSRKAAMDLFCIQCMGGECSEIAKCTAPACPLYPWRPTSFETGRPISAARLAAARANMAKAHASTSETPVLTPPEGDETPE
jgi:hypothetical protein